MNDALMTFTPDLAVLFAVGVLSSGILTASERTRSRPWAWCALAASAPVIALITANGTTWTNINLFWVDLAWGPATPRMDTAAACNKCPRSRSRH